MEALKTIRDTIENSTMEHIGDFELIDDPFLDYPEFDRMELRAILLYPTVAPIEAVYTFLEHKILILPIAFIGYLSDQVRTRRYRWGEPKIAYQTVIRIYFSITESIIKYLLRFNRGLYTIGIDEFGRVLLSKYIRHPREFILNHTKIATSFSPKHLELLNERLAMHSVTSSKSQKESEGSDREPFELPEIPTKFFIDLS